MAQDFKAWGCRVWGSRWLETCRRLSPQPCTSKACGSHARSRGLASIGPTLSRVEGLGFLVEHCGTQWEMMAGAGWGGL